VNKHHLAPRRPPGAALTLSNKTGHRRHASATVILIAMSLSCFTFVVIEALPAGLLTLIAPSLGESTAKIGLLVTAFAGTVALASVPLTHLLRRVPRRWVLTGAFAVAAIATAWGGFADGFAGLLIARILTGAAQAVFWTSVLPGTAGLFPPMVRGKVISRLAIGNALSPVAGIPAGTWLAEHTSWRVTFWVVSAIALIIMAAVATLFPTVKPSEGGAARSPFPSRKRFAFQLVTTILLVTGAVGTGTYVTQYFQDVTGLRQSDMPWLLAIQGIAGIIALLIAGRFLDSHIWHTFLAVAGLTLVSLMVVFAFGPQRGIAIAGICLYGAAMTLAGPVASQRVLLISPLPTDVGTAVSAGMWNLAVGAGAGLSSLLTATVGVRAVPGVGAVLVVGAVIMLLAERQFLEPMPQRAAA
jgi:predicted MFS family arabinose efflux permease